MASQGGELGRLGSEGETSGGYPTRPAEQLPRLAIVRNARQGPGYWRSAEQALAADPQRPMRPPLGHHLRAEAVDAGDPGLSLGGPCRRIRISVDGLSPTAGKHLAGNHGPPDGMDAMPTRHSEQLRRLAIVMARTRRVGLSSSSSAASRPVPAPIFAARNTASHSSATCGEDTLRVGVDNCGVECAQRVHERLG
jgi:hypothetical protein